MIKQYDHGLALGTGKSTIMPSIQRIETHEEVAAKMFNVPVADVTPEQRAYAKRMRFYDLYSTPHTRTDTSMELITMDLAAMEKKIMEYYNAL